MGIKKYEGGYKIEKGIPMPREKYPISEEFPLKEMEVGDSFVLTFEDYAEQVNKQNRVRNTANRLNMKVMIKTLDDHTMRVWRKK